MRKRKIRVIELEDFMCRCGAVDFIVKREHNLPVEMTCKQCGRNYSIKKMEKRFRINNLPMSFGFRSMYWNKIEPIGNSLSGVTEEGYEITEIERPREVK